MGIGRREHRTLYKVYTIFTNIQRDHIAFDGEFDLFIC